MINRSWVLCCLLTVGGLVVPPLMKLETAQAAEMSQQEQLKRYVLGNTLLTLYHEFGHTIVGEFELPVMGKEEDAVDTYSIIALSEITFDEETSDDDAEEIDYYLEAGAHAWYVQAADRIGDYDASDYAGEHSLDIQRFYAHLCLLYGSDEGYYADLVATYEVDAEILEDCAYTYQQSEANWYKLLENNYALLDEDAAAVDHLTILIDDGDEEFARYANWLDGWKWLQDFEDYNESLFDLPEPVEVRFESCGEANAWWDPEEKAITMCYELMADYEQFFPIEIEGSLDERESGN